MNPMDKDTEQAIRKINNSFYNAFEGLSLEKMEEIWKHSDDIVCVHPLIHHHGLPLSNYIPPNVSV